MVVHVPRNGHVTLISFGLDSVRLEETFNHSISAMRKLVNCDFVLKLTLFEWLFDLDNGNKSTCLELMRALLRSATQLRTFAC